MWLHSYHEAGVMKQCWEASVAKSHLRIDAVLSYLTRSVEGRVLFCKFHLLFNKYLQLKSSRVFEYKEPLQAEPGRGFFSWTF